MTAATRTPPRLMAGLAHATRIGPDTHQELHGQLPSLGGDLIDVLERSGLTGCGGAAFPFARKLWTVATQRQRPTVIVNAAEGEPLSWKDTLLITRLPHLVLDGALLTAAALGSREVLLAVKSQPVAHALTTAIKERPDRHPGVQLTVQVLSGGYLIGQESALIAALSGRPAKPTLSPPYPAQRGLGGKPTLVSNAETFAHVALIARHGADWFRALGSPQSPGTRLVTVTGAVSRSGVMEVPGGTELRTVLRAAGGPTELLQGVLFGGLAGTWAGAQATAWRLGDGELETHGAKLGPGIVHLLGASSCPVAHTARSARWLSDQSAGQCGPCFNGLEAIASALEQLCEGGDSNGAFRHVERWCELITGRGACKLPDGAARVVSSALQTFRAEFEYHAVHGCCEACERPMLPRLADSQVTKEAA